MAQIIKPPKPRKLLDPFIQSIHGKRGPCALCTAYSDLTENHIPPEAAGNSGAWLAASYVTSVTASNDSYSPRRFPGGIRFRTLCGDCNNGLGGREDKALIDFYDRVRHRVESPLLIPGVTQISAKPNLILRDLLAHFVSANDSGIPSAFDNEARKLFFKKMSLGLTSWNLYYWIYLRETVFLMRSAYIALWHPTVEVFEAHILKAYPLAFMFLRTSRFLSLPNMMKHVQPTDDAETDIPILMDRRDIDPLWPIVAMGNTAVFLGGNSYGLVARPH